MALPSSLSCVLLVSLDPRHSAASFPRCPYIGANTRIARCVKVRVGKGAFAPCPPSIQIVASNGGHAEFIIGRAFARPVGFAHPISQPSLRAQRSNPFLPVVGALDCFAALAMTRRALTIPQPGAG